MCLDYLFALKNLSDVRVFAISFGLDFACKNWK